MVTDHKAGFRDYVNNNHSIMMTILRSLEASLKLPANTFTSLHHLTNPSGCHVRFITTLPLDENTPRDHALGGEHTDFGSLTILLNRIGGLQVRLPGIEDWVYVKPLPGCAIVNLGDAMVKFTGGILRSNLHRVVTPPGDHWKLQRQSLVYFLRPDHNVSLSRLHGGLIDELGKGDYDGQTSREWLERRHLGRKIEFYKGADTWDSLKGTENRPTAKAI
jgi:isopenicillin N synthase-like dioxygenase